MKPRIGISLVKNEQYSLSSWSTQVNYIKNCINSLNTLEADSVPDIVLFLPAYIRGPLFFSESEHHPKWLKIIKISQGDETSIDLQKYIDLHPCDVYFAFGKIPEFTFNKPFINCVPNFESISHNSFFAEEKNKKEMIVNFIMEFSDKVICHNENIATQLQKAYPQYKNKIIPISFRASFSATQLASNPLSILKKYEIIKQYIYLPCDFKKENNHSIAFEAWHQLKDLRHNYLLICSGKLFHAKYFSKLMHYIKMHNLEDHIRILNFINTQERLQLLRNASAILQTSTHWNTTIENARTLGKIIIEPNDHEEQPNKKTYYYARNNSNNLTTLIEKIWATLPNGYDYQLESIALSNHDLKVREYANDFLNICTSVIGNESSTENNSHKLILNLSKDLQLAQTELSKHTNLFTRINDESTKKLELIAELQIIINHDKTTIDSLQKQYETLQQEKLLLIEDYQKNIDASENSINELEIKNQSVTTPSKHFEKILNASRKIIDEQLEIIKASTKMQEKYQTICLQNDRITQEQRTFIAANEKILLQLQERFEAIIYQQQQTIDSLRYNKLSMQLKRLIKKMIRKIYQFFRPQLGKLNHHPPKPLYIPKWYKKTPANNSKLPLISIVTPSFNQGKFIERTIKSVTQQNYPYLEYIIQDGNSQDETVNVIKKHETSIKHWESCQDQGQSNAINLGFRHATGEIMAYLNSDDLLLPGSLHYVADYFRKNPQVDVVYGHRVLIDENDKEIGRWILPRHNSKILSWADYIPQETLFWRRSMWEKIDNKIDENFRFAMDWDLLLRLREAGATFARLPRFLGAFRVHSQQKTSAEISHTGLKEMQELRYRCHNRHVSSLEINKKIRRYLKWHIVYHKLYKAGILRY